MYCIWLPEGVRQKSCDQCVAQKIPCTIDGIRVSNRKRWDRSGGEGSKPWKKSRVEVEESELESDGSGEDRWRVQGLQSIAFRLLELKESDSERNELLREQNELLRRIAQSLDGGLGAGNESADSTIRE